MVAQQQEGPGFRIRIRDPLMSRRRGNLLVTAASDCYKNKSNSKIDNGQYKIDNIIKKEIDVHM